MAEEILNPIPDTSSQQPAPEQAAPAQNADPLEPDVSDLPPDQANAFARKWSASKEKLVSSTRQQLQAEYDRRLADALHARQQTPEPTMPEPPPDYQENAEEIERVNQELRDMLLDNSLGAVEKAIAVIKAREAAQEAAIRAKWSYQADLLARKYQDWDDMKPKMQDLLKAHPDLAEQPAHLERVYHLAKQFAPPSAPPDPKTFMSDPAYRAWAKEQLGPEVISEYVAGKTQTAQTTPPIMGGSPGGSAPAVPPSMPTTFQMAKRSALSRMGGGTF